MNWPTHSSDPYLHTELVNGSYSLEEVGGASLRVDSVLDVAVSRLDQVAGALDGRVARLDGKEGSQVGRVGGDHDEREAPPDAGDHPRGHGPAGSSRRQRQQPAVVRGARYNGIVMSKPCLLLSDVSTVWPTVPSEESRSQNTPNSQWRVQTPEYCNTCNRDSNNRVRRPDHC